MLFKYRREDAISSENRVFFLHSFATTNSFSRRRSHLSFTNYSLLTLFIVVWPLEMLTTTDIAFERAIMAIRITIFKTDNMNFGKKQNKNWNDNLTFINSHFLLGENTYQDIFVIYSYVPFVKIIHIVFLFLFVSSCKQ